MLLLYINVLLTYSFITIYVPLLYSFSLAYQFLIHNIVRDLYPPLFSDSFHLVSSIMFFLFLFYIFVSNAFILISFVFLTTGSLPCFSLYVKIYFSFFYFYSFFTCFYLSVVVYLYHLKKGRRFYMFKKFLALITLTLIAVSALTGCGTASPQSNSEKTLIIGMNPNFPPFEFTQGKDYVGFDVDLSKAIAEKLGMKPEIKAMAFDGLIPALQSGQIDLIASGMDATPERREHVNFTQTYFKDGYTIVVRKDNDTIHSFDDLKDITVGAQMGTKAADYAKQYGAVVKEFNQNDQCWMELESHTCDAVVVNRVVALYFLNQGGNKAFKTVGEPILSAGVSMATTKENSELTAKVDKALDELKADGTYATLYKKWFGTEPTD